MRRLAALLVSASAPCAALAQASPSAFTTGYRYDAAHRVTGTIAPDPDGTGPLHYLALRNSYDGAGRLTRVEKGELAAWQSEAVAPAAWSGFTVKERVDTVYDALDRKVTESATDPASFAALTLTQTSYDNLGRVDCVAVRMNLAAALPASACTLAAQGSAGPDRIMHNVWDSGSQLLKVQKAYGITTANFYPATLQQDYVTYEYTPDGKQQAVIDANGNRAELTYDGHDRQLRWIFPAVSGPKVANQADYEQYGYDPNGNRTSLRKRDGVTLSYSYDALNRAAQKAVPASATMAAGYTVAYAYDNRGLELSAAFVGGGSISNSYDNAGRLQAATTTLAGVPRTISYAYDADGNATQTSTSAGYVLLRDYDGLGRMTALRQADGSTVATIGYDTGGRRGGVGYAPAGTSSAGYAYDPAGRLQAQTHDLLGTGADQNVTFAYNPASQLVSEARSNGAYAANAAQNVSWSYAVNGLNQYTGVGPNTYRYDANGNLSFDGINTYTYDAENRLVTRSGGVSLTYDPNGRVWQVTGPSGTTRLEYDGDKLVEEFSGAGTQLRVYAHGPGTDEPLVWWEVSPSWQRHFLHADHQGSITAIADDSGNPIAINGYDAWGVPNAGNQGRFGYTGQTWIAELGMWYYKARIYSPMLGRFLQTDPIGYKDQVNLYAYVGNDPVDHTDPSGTKSAWSWVKEWAADQWQNLKDQAHRIPDDLRSLPGHIANGTTGLPPTVSGGMNVVKAPMRAWNVIQLGIAARAEARIGARAAALRAVAGKNTVIVRIAGGLKRVDLAGGAHHSKELGRLVDTPHVQLIRENIVDGVVRSRSNVGDVVPATMRDLEDVARHLKGD